MKGAEGDLWLCEPVNVGPSAPYHLRWLTAKGARPEGGPDTGSLCLQRVVADVRAFDYHRDRKPGICCPLCLLALDSTAPRSGVRADTSDVSGGSSSVSVPALGRAKRLAPVTRLPRPGLRRR